MQRRTHKGRSYSRARQPAGSLILLASDYCSTGPVSPNLLREGRVRNHKGPPHWDLCFQLGRKESPILL